jgi:DNA-binding NtrC family response regulator
MSNSQLKELKNQTKRVLVVDDEETIRKLLSTRFSREGYEVYTAGSGAEGVTKAKEVSPDLVVTDIKMPEMDGFALIDALRTEGHACPVIVITGHGDKECAVEAMHKGAFDYIEKPFDMEDISFSARRAMEREALRKANLRLIDDLKEANSKLEAKLEATSELLDRVTETEHGVALVGESESISGLKSTIRTIAEAFRGDHDPVILINGESGVGKEVVARYLHEQTFSLRAVVGADRVVGASRSTAKPPFVAVNCGAFPENLLESELFGYERGAFTGANQRKLGLFELANGGTIFLDEIGEMDLRMQVKLLRVLQERVIRRLGGTQDIPVHANIVAATNRDLASAVQQKTFREDLYYRLNTLPLVIPPLRSRVEDIVPLAEHFLKRTAGKKFKGFSSGAVKAMQGYRWPGNVRELKSVIDRAVILEKGPEVELPQLRQETMRMGTGGGVATVTNIFSSSGARDSTSTQAPVDSSGSSPGGFVKQAIEMIVGGKTFAEIRKEADEVFVRDVLMQYLEREKGNVSAVARDLKMDRANLLRMFRRYNIDAEMFRGGKVKSIRSGDGGDQSSSGEQAA